MQEYTLENDYIKLKFLDYGAVITSLYFKEQEIETVLSYDNYDDYLDNPIHLGVSCVGPYAGRIENAIYTIFDEPTHLDKNSGNHSIHGGNNSFSNHYFDVVMKEDRAELTLNYKDLTVKMSFIIKDKVFTQEIYASTKKETVFNPTNHSYFNLNSEDCLSYIVDLKSDYMYYLSEDGIPDVKVPVSATEFDVLNGNGSIDECKNEQFEFTKLIDHPFHITSGGIKVKNPENNVELNILSNKNFAVVYTGNHMGDHKTKINGRDSYDHMGICIELQNVPNGVNNDNEFGSILYPGDHHYSLTKYFLTDKEEI